MYRFKSILLLTTILLYSINMSAQAIKENSIDSGTSTSKIIIDMKSSDGYGWRGSYIRIIKDGEEIGTATYSGTDSTAEFEYDPNCKYDFYWEVGDRLMSYVCSFVIIIDGRQVFSAGRSDCPNWSDGKCFFTQRILVGTIQIWTSGSFSWNDGKIIIQQDGIDIGSVTHYDGVYTTCKTFNYTPNSDYTFYWKAGNKNVVPNFRIDINGITEFSTESNTYSDGQLIYATKDEKPKFQINMYDGFGDGWTNNTILVLQDGVEIGKATIETGKSAIAEFEYSPNSEYTFCWLQGEYARECSFDIVVSGNTIFQATLSDCAAFENGEIIFTKSKPRMYIKMWDVQRNGWNGNAIIVKKDDIELDTITILSGGRDIIEIEYCPSSVYTFYWKKGIYSHQCSFDIIIDGEKYYMATTSDCTNLSDNQLIYRFTSSIEIFDGSTSKYYVSENKSAHTIRYIRTLPNAKWNSLYVPFKIPIDILTDKYEIAYFNNMHAYDNNNDGLIDIMDMEIIPITEGTLHANYPYFIRAKNEEAQTMDIELTDAVVYQTQENSLTCSSVYNSFELKGIYTQRTAEELTDCYAINTSGAWSPVAVDSYLNPFRLYLKITSKDGAPVEVAPSALQSIRIRLKGEYTTDIDEVETQHLGTTIIYDLSGRRVENPDKGVYIVNGKKIMLK